MKSWTTYLRIGLATALVAGVAWFGYGWLQSERFERRLASLRAEGRVQTLDDWRAGGLSSASTGNGWIHLQMAAQEQDSVEEAWDQVALEQGREPLWLWGPEALTPARRADARRYLESVEPVFALLDQALQAQVICRSAESPEDSAFHVVFRLCQLCSLAAKVKPQEADAYIERMLRLLRAWDSRATVDLSLRAHVLQFVVLRALRDYLQTGPVDPRVVDPWLELLAPEEATLVRHAKELPARLNMDSLWLIQAWRRGEDPTANMRTRIREMRSVPPNVSSELEDIRGLEPVIGNWLRALEPPWYTRWYGWPQLQQKANELLDEFEARVPAQWSLADMRATVNEGTRDAMWRSYSARVHAGALHAITAVRLARVALAAQGLRVSPPVDAVELHAAVTRRLQSPWPTDALSDLPLELRAEDGAFELRAPTGPWLARYHEAYVNAATDELSQHMQELALIWRVRTRQ